MTDSDEPEANPPSEPGADPTSESVGGPSSDPTPDPAEVAAAPGEAPADPVAAEPDTEPIDLDGIERDLNDVQTSLDRLNDGTYWTDEITGETIPDDVLTEHPTTRSASRSATEY